MKAVKDTATTITKTPKLAALERVKLSQSRRVSFGPQLSPEQFVANLPPNTPVKKGALPMQSLGNTDEPNRRRSVLKEGKRKSKGASPKIIKTSEDSTPKPGRKRSFDELVALVGLDNVPKVKTPKRRSVGKQKIQEDLKETPAASANAETKKTPKRRSKASADEVAAILTATPPEDKAGGIKTNQAERKSIRKSPIENPDLFEEKSTPGGQRSRRSSKGSTVVTPSGKHNKDLITHTPALDDTMPVNPPRTSGMKKRRSSIKGATPTDCTPSADLTQPIELPLTPGNKNKRHSITAASSMDGTVPVEESPALKDTGRKRRSSVKPATPKTPLDGAVPPQDVTIDEVHDSENDTDDTMPYDEIVGTETNEPTESPDFPKLERSARLVLDDTIPFIEKSVASETPSQKRKSIRKSRGTPAGTPDGKSVDGMPESAKMTPKTPAPMILEINQGPPVRKGPGRKSVMKTPKSGKNESIGDEIDVAEDVSTTEVGSNKRTPGRKSIGKTPKSVKSTPVMIDGTNDVAEDVPIPEIGSNKRTPGRKSVGKTPNSVQSTPVMIGGTNDADSRTPGRKSIGKTPIPYGTPVIAPEPNINDTPAQRHTPGRKSVGITPKSLKNTPVDSIGQTSSDLKHNNATPASKGRTPSRKSVGNTPTATTTPAITPEQDINDTPAQRRTPGRKSVGKTPKSSKSTPVVESVTQTPDALNPSDMTVSTPEVEIADTHDRRRTPGRKSVGQTPATGVTPGRKSIGKTPKSLKSTPVVDHIEDTTADESFGNSEIENSRMSASPKMDQKSFRKTPKSVKNTPAAEDYQEASEDDETAVYTVEIDLGTPASRTPARKSIGKTPKSVKNTPGVRIVEIDISTPASAPKRTPGRKSIAKTPKSAKKDRVVKKTPRPATPAQLAAFSARATASRSATKRRKSGVTLWSEIVKRNVEKQPETRQTDALQEQDAKPPKRGRKPMPKTPQQLRAMRHVDSPATIYIGRRERRRENLTPVTFSMDDEYSSEESFTENEESILSTTESGNTVSKDDHETNLPEQGDQNEHEEYGTARLMKTPKEKSEMVENDFGTKRLMKTPKVRGEEVTKNFGTKRLLQTPKERVKGQPVEDKFGTKRLLQTPKEKIKAQEISGELGIARMVKTPKVKGQPVEDKFGTKRLLKTPKEKVKGQPVENHFGTKRLMQTPKEKVTSHPVTENYGIQRIMKTPRQKSEPVTENFGTKRLLQSPRERIIVPPVEEDYGFDKLYGEEEMPQPEKSVATSTKKISSTKKKATKKGTKAIVEEKNQPQEAPESMVPEEDQPPVVQESKTTRRGLATRKLSKEESPVEASENVEQKVASESTRKNARSKKSEDLKESENKSRTTRGGRSTRSKVTEMALESEQEPVKRSVRKRKTPATVEKSVAMPDKKVKFDIPKEASETATKKANRSTKKSKETKSSAPIGNSAGEEVSTDTQPVEITGPKRSTRGRAAKPKETMPTQKPTKGRKVADTKPKLEAIKEQDENEAVVETVVPTRAARGRSTKVTKKPSKTVPAEATNNVESDGKMPVASEPKASARSSRGKNKKSSGEVETPIEIEIAPVDIPSKKVTRGRKAPTTVASEHATAPEITLTRNSRSRKSPKEELVQPVKKSSGKTIGASKQAVAPESCTSMASEQTVAPEITSTRSSRNRKTSKEELAAPTKRSSTKMANETSEPDAAPKTATTAPKRSSRSRKASKDDVIPAEVIVSTESKRSRGKNAAKASETAPEVAPVTSKRRKKSSEDANVDQISEKAETEPKRSTRKKQPTVKTLESVPDVPTGVANGKKAKNLKSDEKDEAMEEKLSRQSRKRRAPEQAAPQTAPKRPNKGKSAVVQVESTTEGKPATRKSSPKKKSAKVEQAPVRKSTRRAK